MRATESPPAGVERERLPPFVFGPFAFDARRGLLSRNGRELPLPPRVLGVLELLVRRAGDVVARQDIIDAVWKDAFVTDTSLAEAVSVLRQTLGDDPQSPTYIKTLHRRGYRFVAPVERSDAAAERTESRGADPLTVSALPAADVAVSPSIGRQLVPWSVAIVCAAIAITAVWHVTRRTPVLAPSARFAVAPAAGTSLDASAPALAISPDGVTLAWSACDAKGCRLYLRPLDRLEASPIDGTDDGHAPFFSPDGKWVAFFSDGRLKKVAIAGGAPETLADAPSILGGVWVGSDIVYAGSPSGGLMRVAASGGEPRILTRPDEAAGEVRHAWPSFVPDTGVLLFTIDSSAVEGTPGVLGALSLDSIGPTEATSWRTTVDGVAIARAAGTDAIVFARGTDLHAVAFDPVRLVTAGAPRTVLAGVGAPAQYALSSSGSLIYALAPQADTGLTWLSATASELARPEIRRLRSAALSPDGARIAGVNADGARSDIWIADAVRGASTRLTHSGAHASPVWSADGRTVFFAARSDGAFGIWSRDAEGTRPATRLWTGVRHALPLAASPDGALLVFSQTSPSTARDLWALPLSGGNARPLAQGPFDETAASFSPDASLLAYQSAESGRWEIYVLRQRDGRRIVVSTEGGEHPVWTRDGLYYQTRLAVVRAAISADGDNLSVASIQPIATVRGAALQGVSPDGRVLVDRVADLSGASAVVSLEWRRELRMLLGPPAASLPR
jgi:DNA-binding winged helix-turn-helix (wHTH) protein/Tol biopolymer transport system component